MIGYEQYCKLRIMQAISRSRPIHSVHLPVLIAHIASLAKGWNAHELVYSTEAHYKKDDKRCTNRDINGQCCIKEVHNC
jgi:hypothetical protein